MPPEIQSPNDYALSVVVGHDIIQANVQAEEQITSQNSETYPPYRKHVVIAAASATLFIGVGYANTFGVFQEYYQANNLKDERPDKIIVIGSTAASLYLILGAFTGRFADLVGYRVSLLIGAALMIGSMFVASASTTYVQLFLSQGLMFGLGVAFSYLPAVSISRQYWKQNHGVASAMVVSGGALGGCILPYIVRLLITQKGLPGTFRILGYLAAGVLLPSSFLLRPAETTVPIWLRRSTDQRIPILDLSLLRDSRFNALLIPSAIAMIGFLPRYFLIPESAVAQGVSTVYASWLLGLMNGLSIIGRIGIGWIADRFGKVTALTISFICCGLGHFMFWLPGVSVPNDNEATVMAMFTLFVVYIGIFGSGFLALFPVVIAHLFGSEALASKQGLLNTVVGLGSFAGPSAVYAIVGDGRVRHWSTGVISAGLFMLVGGLLLLALLGHPSKPMVARR
ncbi:hypothetical protein H2198_009650 [Neophaeococcomyces mojaviensis]|uniref:Uncharacterized protein n=1 Tax=Neophaeococcomyces mojaviensis TaxID=3383035 RepID=A0ACC2ZTW9_9EURO|nr:hypothetical protein H2198_009650 [Knufia sp. JES_112]